MNWGMLYYWDVLLVLTINGSFHPFKNVGWIRPAK